MIYSIKMTMFSKTTKCLIYIFRIICINGQTDMCRTVSSRSIKVYSGLSLSKKHSEFTTLKEPLKLASSRSPARAGRSGTRANGRNSSKEGNKISW